MGKSDDFLPIVAVCLLVCVALLLIFYVVSKIPWLLYRLHRLLFPQWHARRQAQKRIKEAAAQAFKRLYPEEPFFNGGICGDEPDRCFVRILYRRNEKFPLDARGSPWSSYLILAVRKDTYAVEVIDEDYDNPKFGLRLP